MQSLFTTTYQAAQAIAGTIEDHFARMLQLEMEKQATDLAPEPVADHIELLLDTAFWVSLRHEEGLSPRISLAYISPEHVPHPLLFEKRMPLSSASLTKISPGVERPGIHLGVWHENNELYIWGTTSTIPSLCMVVDVSEPGLLVVKHRRTDGFGKFANVAVLKGDEVKIVDEQAAHIPDCPSVVTSLLKFNGTYNWDNSYNILVQLAVSMRAHKRGGILVVTPSESDTWTYSMVQPLAYAVQPAFSVLADLVREAEKEENRLSVQDAIRREVDLIAGLTAIDGATIINDKYELLAFGAKIGRLQGNESVHQIVLTEPVVGGVAKTVHPSLNGGTRHLAAAQFVHDQREAIALVASQDGRFTIFSWSVCEEVVQAHRIDILLL
ncbi:putative sensor domain DACNV-containing protein [Pontibacter sp. H249]|uniref:putative sensor domain DACNV-containing protein n=1 Tax=Pontibacter sp. H249 TaxID=3133420 RepID=UPI0030BA8D72